MILTQTNKVITHSINLPHVIVRTGKAIVSERRYWVCRYVRTSGHWYLVLTFNHRSMNLSLLYSSHLSPYIQFNYAVALKSYHTQQCFRRPKLPTSQSHKSFSHSKHNAFFSIYVYHPSGISESAGVHKSERRESRRETTGYRIGLRWSGLRGRLRSVMPELLPL